MVAADEGLSALPEATGRISWKTGAAEPRPYLRPPCGGPVDEGRRPYLVAVELGVVGPAWGGWGDRVKTLGARGHHWALYPK